MNTRLWGIVLFSAVGIGIGVGQPFAPGLSPAGHAALMSILVAVGLWIFGTQWVPLSIGGMVMLLLLTARASGPPWSSRLHHPGGLDPDPCPLLRLRPELDGARQKARLLGHWPLQTQLPEPDPLLGPHRILLSVLTPSITVRIAIVIPIAVATVEICRLQYGSRGAALILLSAWSMVLIPAVAG